MQEFQFAIGQELEFDYPAANYPLAGPRFKRRRLRLEQVRDLAIDPVTQLTTMLDPWLKRSRYLLTGVDLDQGEERSFYLGAMKDIQIVPEEPADPVGSWRVYLLDPEGESAAELVHQASSLAEAAAWAEEWQNGPLGLCPVLCPPGAVL